MLNHNVTVGLRGLTLILIVISALPGLGASGCSGSASDAATTGAVTSATAVGTTTATTSSTTSTTSSTTTTSFNTTSSINAIQVITKADPTGSFDPVSVPLAGGSSVRANRLYNLDGSLITAGTLPPWFIEARVFLTSTRTTSGAPSSTNGWDTPCAYFDNVTDNNPDSSGFYTIDGYNTDNALTDVDQCAGTAGSELSQLGIYVRLDRRFMNPTDKVQLIVKAKPIDAPNTTLSPSSCVTSGFFDPGACSNQLFTMTMRTAPNASSKPFYILFPSAKANDLLSESVLLPINIDQSVSTISVDRVKGGAIFYGISIIRLQ